MREKAEKEDEERIARGEAPSNKGPQWRPGIAYEGKQLATSHNFHKGVDVFAEPDKVSLAGCGKVFCVSSCAVLLCCSIIYHFVVFRGFRTNSHWMRGPGLS